MSQLQYTRRKLNNTVKLIMNKEIFEEVALKMMNTEATMPDKKYVVEDETIISEIKNWESLDGCDRDGRTLLINAATYGRKKLVEFLLKENADIHQVDKQKFTALHSAVISGDIDCVKMLLEAGCDPNQENAFGNNSLMVCKLNTNRDIFRLLIEYGANPTKKNNYGYSAQDIFCAYEDIMELLK